MIFFFFFGPGPTSPAPEPPIPPPIVAHVGGGAPVGSYGHYVFELGDVRARVRVIGASDEELLSLIKLFLQVRGNR